jgi:hypothetical protein
MKFDFKNSHGADVCSVVLTHLWADVYGIVQKTDQSVEPEIWLELISKAIASAKDKGARYLQFRLIERQG